MTESKNEKDFLDRIGYLEDLEKNATQGPWAPELTGGHWKIKADFNNDSAAIFKSVGAVKLGADKSFADAVLITAIRNELPDLLSEYRKIYAELEQLRDEKGQGNE